MPPVATTNRWQEYKAVPPLKGPNGYQVANYNPMRGDRVGMIITNKCKHPEIAFRWADALYDKKITMRSLYEIKGKEWDWVREGDVGINGEPAIWTSIIKGKGEIVENVAWG